MIYFIRDLSTGHVKIGSSIDPWKRLRYLQTGCPGELEMVALDEGGEAEERKLHGRFATQRLRGEWYRRQGDLQYYLASKPRPFPPESERGTQARICRATGLSAGVVSELATGKRRSAGPLAVIYRQTGVKLGALAAFPDDQVRAWAAITIAMHAEPVVRDEAA